MPRYLPVQHVQPGIMHGPQAVWSCYNTCHKQAGEAIANRPTARQQTRCSMLQGADDTPADLGIALRGLWCTLWTGPLKRMQLPEDMCVDVWLDVLQQPTLVLRRHAVAGLRACAEGGHIDLQGDQALQGHLRPPVLAAEVEGVQQRGQAAHERRRVPRPASSPAGARSQVRALRQCHMRRQRCVRVQHDLPCACCGAGVGHAGRARIWRGPESIGHGCAGRMHGTATAAAVVAEALQGAHGLWRTRTGDK